MTAQPMIRVTDDPDQAGVEEAIRVLRDKQRRMPAHWVERRAAVGDDIDELVDMWLALA